MDGPVAMSPEDGQRMYEICTASIVLCPQAFQTVVDRNAKFGDRREAFDQLWKHVEEPCLQLPTLFAMDDFRRRTIAAMYLFQIFHKGEEIDQGEIILEASKVVPAPDVPGFEGRTMQLFDQEALRFLIVRASQKFPQAWEDFYKADSVPLDRRRKALASIVGYVNSHLDRNAPVFSHQTEVERERIVILGLMCFVPKEQWTSEDLKDLYDTMTPLGPDDYESAEPGPLGL
jgi:hypothetical protein